MLLAGMLSFYACGPSAEEKEKAAQNTKDSIASAAAADAAKETAKRIADSAAKAQADTANAKAARDSAAVKKGGKKGK